MRCAPPHQVVTNSITPKLQAILQTANKLRDLCAENGSISSEITEPDDWDAAFAQRTRAWVEESLSRVRDVVKRAKSTPNPPTVKTKPVFNHEYTPLLDKYFEYNAYPSAPDRAILARKSMMTSRQIEVWFQNHRNRAKKEGKVLRRLTEPLPHEISLDSLERQMPHFTIPMHGQKVIEKPDPLSDESDGESTVRISGCALETRSPIYYF
ncbi:hypothetical protein C0989_005509 [Termitomyces sp. Mn162]|nr:hypothetical protein C0989_005509 [Termitomyces sp. Mn162]